MTFGKQLYRKHKTEGFPLWCQAHYLDAVAGSQWDCRFVVEDDEVVAVWVYGQTSKMGLRSMNFPTFLKYNGPFFLDKLERDRYDDIGKGLFDSMPYFVKMSMEFQPEIHDKLPLLVESMRSKSFSQLLRHTYVWEIKDTQEELSSRMDGNYRRMINKHKESLVLQPASVEEARNLYDFHSKWVDDLVNHGVSRERFNAVIKSVYENKTGQVIDLEYEGRKISSVLIIYDRSQAYYLLSVNNKEYKKIYPAVLMANELAGYLSIQGIRSIDFLGSDIEAIGRVWRKIGAKKKDYLFINKKFNLPF